MTMDGDAEQNFEARFDQREEARINSDLHALIARCVSEPEAGRVAAIIDRDKAERIAEQDRKLATLEVKRGVFANLADTVMPPTPEWLAKGDVRSFTPRLIGEGGRTETVKTVKTVRRLEISTITRLHLRGKLTDEELWVCVWFRDLHERAGLDGRYKSSHLSLAGNVGGGGGGAQHPMAGYEAEADARNAYRAARKSLTAFYVRFFEAVVIGDVPVRRAARFARCRAERAVLRLRQVIGELIDHCNQVGVEIMPSAGWTGA